ncbi:MAG: hypothetical protein Q9174_004036 [Haloplaca sp. 1 TL-2023]
MFSQESSTSAQGWWSGKEAHRGWSDEDAQGEAPRSLFIIEADEPEEAPQDSLEYVTEYEKLRRRDSRICQLPSWSSTVPDLTMAEVSFTFKTPDKTLEFLSQILNEDRQVDIGFPGRYALVSFLLQRLEESHFEFLRLSHPQEFKILDMPSADIFELHVWQAYVRRGHLKSAPLEHATDETGRCYEFVSSLDYLRQVVEHRPASLEYNFDSSMIKAAAACASHLGDSKLLEDIDNVVKVLYADNNGESAVTVSEQQRNAAHGVLWPCNRPARTVTQLLREVQNIAENACFESCRSRLPTDSEDLDVKTAEHLELTAWVRFLEFRSGSETHGDAELHDKLDFWTGRHLRNAAAHRTVNFNEHTLEERAERIGRYVDSGLDVVEALNDGDAISKIKALKAEVIPLLVQQHEEWLRRDQWETEAFLVHEKVASERVLHWRNLIGEFYDKKNVDIRPITDWYYQLAERRRQYGPQAPMWENWAEFSTEETQEASDWSPPVVPKTPRGYRLRMWLRKTFARPPGWVVRMKMRRFASKCFGCLRKRRSEAETECQDSGSTTNRAKETTNFKRTARKRLTTTLRLGLKSNYTT